MALPPEFPALSQVRGGSRELESLSTSGINGCNDGSSQEWDLGSICQIYFLVWPLFRATEVESGQACVTIAQALHCALRQGVCNPSSGTSILPHVKGFGAFWG
jgi:hypothetical protein